MDLFSFDIRAVSNEFCELDRPDGKISQRLVGGNENLGGRACTIRTCNSLQQLQNDTVETQRFGDVQQLADAPE